MANAFYGISFNITGFGLNIYLTQFTYALIELPAKVSVYYLLDKIGRRCTEVGSLLMAGVCLGINILVPKGGYFYYYFQSYIEAFGHFVALCNCFRNDSDLFRIIQTSVTMHNCIFSLSHSLLLDMSVARTVVAVIGKGFSSASFATIVLYSSELYPTVVR